MQLTLLKGYPDFVGKRATFVGWGNGPASYNQTTGDVISLPQRNYYIDAVAGGVNSINLTTGVMGGFYVRAQSSGVGPRMTWALFWFTPAGLPVGNGVNLSGEQVQIGGNCGQY
jgi:hypothetical protein